MSEGNYEVINSPTEIYDAWREDQKSDDNEKIRNAEFPEEVRDKE